MSIWVSFITWLIPRFLSTCYLAHGFFIHIHTWANVGVYEVWNFDINSWSKICVFQHRKKLRYMPFYSNQHAHLDWYVSSASAFVPTGLPTGSLSQNSVNHLWLSFCSACLVNIIYDLIFTKFYSLLYLSMSSTAPECVTFQNYQTQGLNAQLLKF